MLKGQTKAEKSSSPLMSLSPGGWLLRPLSGSMVIQLGMAVLSGKAGSLVIVTILRLTEAIQSRSGDKRSVDRALVTARHDIESARHDRVGVVFGVAMGKSQLRSCHASASVRILPLW